MTANLLTIEMDTKGEPVEIYSVEMIGNSILLPSFLRNFAELMENGHTPNFLAATNRHKAIYAIIDGNIAGYMVYEFIDDLLKTTWITFSCVEKNFRQRGLYKILYRNLEGKVRTAGSKKITSYVHVTNLPMIASSKAAGAKPVFYKMEKDLD